MVKVLFSTKNVVIYSLFTSVGTIVLLPFKTNKNGRAGTTQYGQYRAPTDLLKV